MAKKESELIEEVRHNGVFTQTVTKINTQAGLEELVRLQQARPPEPEYTLRRYEEQASAILESEGWPATGIDTMRQKLSGKEEPSRRAKDADEILTCAKFIRVAWSGGDLKRGILEGIRLGRAATRAHVRPLEDAVDVGRKVIGGGSKRSNRTYDEQHRFYSEIQRWVINLAAADPTMTWGQIQKRAHAHFGVSTRQIRRKVANPKKRKILSPKV